MVNWNTVSLTGQNWGHLIQKKREFKSSLLPITNQPIYYVAESFEDAKEKLMLEKNQLNNPFV